MKPMTARKLCEWKVRVGAFVMWERFDWSTACAAPPREPRLLCTALADDAPSWFLPRDILNSEQILNDWNLDFKAYLAATSTGICFMMLVKTLLTLTSLDAILTEHKSRM